MSQNYDIVTIGSMFVEIMRKELEKPLSMPADFTGPYPSGDIAIFLNAAAKLGSKCAIIGAVADDGFGKCVMDRMQESGVDLSMVKVIPGEATGSAFVCYFADGSRNFIYHVRHEASGMVGPEDVDMSRLQNMKWFHSTGYEMSINKGFAEATYKVMENLPAGTKVSFDPNIRPESLSVEQIIALCEPVLKRADVVFPSKGEAKMFTGAASDEEGCRQWAKEGKLVVLKNGSAGSRIYSGDEAFDVPSFHVTEVDPTGAGDTFCGAFLTALVEGKDLRECARFANAAGALSVLKQGPMEGAPSRAELDAFLASQPL